MKVPSTSSQDAAISTAHDLLYALKNSAPSSPILQLGDEKIRALEKLAAIFYNNIKYSSITTPCNRGWILLLIFHLKFTNTPFQ